MKYHNGAAFRQALEDRFRAQSRTLGVPLVRLRKMVAFERFLARLTIDRPGQWLLKGGLALQWRLGNLTRTTKDLDVLLAAPVRDIHEAMVQAALLDLGDWFRFLVQQSSGAAVHAGAGQRFHVHSQLGGRPFEDFHADVGWGDPVVEPPEQLTAPSLLEFADIEPVTVLCYPVTQHIAEKVHAYTRPHVSGGSSRVKDLVDIILIAQANAIDRVALSRAIGATFAARATHPLPQRLPDAPVDWAAPFGRMARDVGLGDMTLLAAVSLAHTFLDPVLRAETQGVWDPASCAWR